MENVDKSELVKESLDRWVNGRGSLKAEDFMQNIMEITLSNIIQNPCYSGNPTISSDFVLSRKCSDAPYFYFRLCYKQLLQHIAYRLQVADEKKEVVHLNITGTPRIGKTAFGLILYKCLPAIYPPIKKGAVTYATYTQHGKDYNINIIVGTVFPGTDKAECFTLQDDRKTNYNTACSGLFGWVRLIDGCPPKKGPGKMHTIYFNSPKSSNQKIHYKDTENIWLPLWSQKELKTAHRELLNANDLVELDDAQFEILQTYYGGICEPYLQMKGSKEKHNFAHPNTTESDILSSMYTKIQEVEDTQFNSILGSKWQNVQEKHICALLHHETYLRPVELDDRIKTWSRPWRNSQAEQPRLASTLVGQMFRNRLKAYNANERFNLFLAARGTSAGGILAGNLYEQLVSPLLASGREIQYVYATENISF